MTVDHVTRKTHPSGRGVSRRTLVAGAAWALPDVVVATAAPAAAASPAMCGYTFATIGLTCRYGGPGNKDYKVGLRVDRVLSCSEAPVTITGIPTPVTDTGTATFTQGLVTA